MKNHILLLQSCCKAKKKLVGIFSSRKFFNPSWKAKWKKRNLKKLFAVSSTKKQEMKSVATLSLLILSFVIQAVHTRRLKSAQRSSDKNYSPPNCLLFSYVLMNTTESQSWGLVDCLSGITLLLTSLIVLFCQCFAMTSMKRNEWNFWAGTWPEAMKL